MTDPAATPVPGAALSQVQAPFTTLAGPHRSGLVVDNSEFLALAQRADTPEQALAQLAAVRSAHRDATHHCWAYRIGALYRFHDDGEPGGTAGAPILRAAEGQGVDHVMVVVTRYYGGVKLGAGGLVRAYGGAAAECLRAAPRTLVRPRVALVASVPFEFLGGLYHLLGPLDAVRGEESYSGAGLSLPLSLFPEDVAAFAAALRDVTRGAGTLDPAG